jgi:sigma-E factor negative regulatory protein RseC
VSEIGQVIEKRENNRLLIRLERQEACAKCRACTAGMKTEEMLLEAENLCNANVGDSVDIALEETDFMKAVLIMYGIPFACFVAGVLGGYFALMHFGVNNAEALSFVIGIVLVVLAYAVIHSFEPHFQKDNYVPKAVNVVNK